MTASKRFRLITVPDDPLVPLHLLMWSVETALTTLVCVVDVFNWPGYSGEEVLALQQLYLPYLLLGELAFENLHAILLANSKCQLSVWVPTCF